MNKQTQSKTTVLFYSLNRQSPDVDFREATLRGQAPDKGLYFPRTLPQLDAEVINHPERYTDHELAYRIIAPYVGASIPEAHLRRIVAETLNFPTPLVSVTENSMALELYHGPTLAFKDVGARFMSRCLGYFVQHPLQGTPAHRNAGRVFVLVATSGDTGGAVAHGFHG